jgi:hypothetical protein
LTDPTGARWQRGFRDDVLNLFPNPNSQPQAFPTPETTIHARSQPQYRPYTSRKSSSVSCISATTMPEKRTNTTDDDVDAATSPSVSSLVSRLDSTALIVDRPESASLHHNAAQRPDVPGTMQELQTNPDAQLQGMPLSVRRRIELQMRVNRARDVMPNYIKLRIFKEPLECTEAEEIMHDLGL